MGYMELVINGSNLIYLIQYKMNVHCNINKKGYISVNLRQFEDDPLKQHEN